MSETRTKRTILIVDDEEHLRRALERSFRHEGYETRLASSGDEALALMQGEEVDLVITDLVMPGMDGMALVREIRGSHPKIKVIILTAYGSDESMTEAEALGVAYYLAKPFDLFHLKSRVKRLLRAPESACGRTGIPAFHSVCSGVGHAARAVSALPRMALTCIHPKRLIYGAGSAVGSISGMVLGLLQRLKETGKGS